MSRTSGPPRASQRTVVGRRQFLAGSLGTGLATAAGALTLPATGRAEIPKAGGQLHLAATAGSTLDVLDPAVISSYFTFVINWAIRNCLVEVDADGIARPELAESWDASSDAATWAFKLRKDVQFHNGKRLAATDVIWSINQHRGSESKSAAKSIVSQISDLRSDGQGSVVFVLKSGNLDFPYILSDPHLTIALEGTKGPEWDRGIGTGGYVLKEWQPGVRARLVRQANYWKAGRAHFDSVDILNVTDVSARTSALLSGEVDLVVNPDLRTVDRLKTAPEIQVVETVSNGHISMPMFTDVSPFSDNNVRMALKYGIDREEFLRKILHGHGSLGNDQPINETYRFYAKDIPQRRYDPDKAKFHLRQANLPGLKVELSTADAAFNGAVDAAVLYAGRAAAAGIEIRVVREPNDSYWQEVWRKKPFCVSHWNGRSTADWMFSMAYAAGASWNETRWKNDTFNELLAAARIERDEQKRTQMYHDMQMLIRDEGGAIIPAFDNYVMVGTSKLKHGKVATNWNLDGYRLPERWWFE